MDITLERIFSLVDKRPDGSFAHGAKKKFCDSIGAPSNIMNAWERGTNHSYRNYLYQISAVYNVSVEWLKGETDEKTKKAAPEIGDGTLTESQQELFALVQRMSDDEITLFLDIARRVTGQKPSTTERV